MVSYFHFSSSSSSSLTSQALIDMFRLRLISSNVFQVAFVYLVYNSFFATKTPCVLHPLPTSPRFDHPYCLVSSVSHECTQYAVCPTTPFSTAHSGPNIFLNALFTVGPAFTAIWNNDRHNINHVVCVGLMAVGVRFV